MDDKYLDKVSFLIVEDNQFMRMIVRRVLSVLSARDIREAEDGQGAFKVLQIFQPDIAFVDWEMKPMNGIEFVKAVRRGENNANPFMPIVMLSAHSELARVTAARDTGINEFVVKPISVKTLYNRIQAIIERPRPFVRTEMYFGPDRRRQSVRHRGPERRGQDADFTSAEDENAFGDETSPPKPDDNRETDRAPAKPASESEAPTESA